MLSAFSNLIIEEDKVEEFSRHLELKGEERYKSLYDYLLLEEEYVDYIKLSHYYRYDIKVRRVLYKTITLLETSMKAYINNKYKIIGLTLSNYEERLSSTLNCEIDIDRYNLQKVRRILSNKTYDLYQFLEEADTGLLFNIFLCLSPNDLKGFFDDIDGLESKLSRARRLRNKVYHHNIVLISDYTYESIDYTLNEEVSNLVSLIPRIVRNNLSDDINAAIYIDECKEKNELNTYCLNSKDFVKVVKSNGAIK